MKKNVLNNILLTLLIFTLSSCDLSGLTSGLQDIIDSKLNDINSPFEEGDNSYGFHDDDCGNSLQLINETFNATTNNKGTILKEDFSNYTLDYQNNDGYEVINFNNNIQDLEYFNCYTPSVGNVNGLVIPVDFIDYPISNKVYENINVDYQSVSSYYYNSSYGKLNMTFDILPWFRASKSSSHYASLTQDNQSKYYGEAPGASSIIHEALSVAAKTYDLSKYDSNNDGCIDALYIIYNHPIMHNDTSFWWAFQYFTFEDYKFDGLYSYNYVFSSFDFLFEDQKNNNPRTLIHETGHMFGLEDYYDYDTNKGYNKGSLGGFDIMDCTIGQHNSFSKISLGWIDKVLLVKLDENESIDITINDISSSGNVIMVCDEYDANKGMYQSYFLFELIDVQSPLLYKEFTNLTYDGVRVYRVNAELKTYKEDGYTYDYYRYNNSYEMLNLIDALNSPNGTIYSKFKYNNGIIFTNSDLFTKSLFYTTLKYEKLNSSYSSSYTFCVKNIENNQATISFKRS